MPKETREYAVPLYSFPETEDGETEGPKKPESEDEERIVVSYYEHQTGNDSLRAYHYHGDGTRDHYNFRVTEKKGSKWCGYTGESPADVPVDILHAVHNFGYGIHNIETLGFWFSTWCETEYGIDILEQICREAEDEFMKLIAEKSINLYKAVRLGALIRLRLGEQPSKEIWNAVGNRIEKRTDVSPDTIKKALMNTSGCGTNDSIDEYIASLRSVTPTFESHRNRKNGKEMMDVDIITPSGINRVPCEKQGKNEYVLRRSHIPHRAPVITKKMEYGGHTLSNAKTVLGTESETEQVTCILKTLSELEKTPLMKEDELYTFHSLIAESTLAILSLQEMMITKKFDNELYHESINTVADHLDIENISTTNIEPEKIVEMCSVVLRLMPPEVQEDIDDWIKTSGVFSNNMLEKYGLRDR